jgi:hydroxyacylglutathione hydrolase
VIDVPGHTIGHIAFHFPALGRLYRRQPDGDRLRAYVRGRRPPMMWASLQNLPPCLPKR